MTTTQHPPSTAMAIIDPRHVPLAVQVFGEERLNLLAEQVGRGWKVPPTPAELEVIALICQENRFDIFAKPPQIHFIKRWDSKLNKDVMTPQVSIDGARLAASRSRNYLGPAGYAWCGDDGVWKDVWLAKQPPRAARAGVFIRGQREPMYAVAMWDEWAQWQDEWEWDDRQHKNVKTGGKVLAPFWQSKPAHMLAKTAEMIVIKQACPAETNEFEIAHLEELDRLEAPARAAMYERIYGTDDDRDRDGIPPTTALAAGGHTVDTRTGEVLAEGGDVFVAEHSAGAAPPADPQRAEMVAMYDTLLAQALRDGVVTAGDKKWLLGTRDGVVEVISKGRELRALVNAAQIARSSHQQAPDPDPDPEPEPAATTSDLWAEHRRLVTEAHKRKLETKTLPARSSAEAIAAANAALAERIANLDLDAQLERQQAQAF